MKENILLHYIRSYRKRKYLTQEDVAILLGRHTANTTSKLERKMDVPEVNVAIGLTIILDSCFCNLFEGAIDKARREIKENAKKRLKELRSRSPDSLLTGVSEKKHQQRIKSLERLAK